MTQSSAPQHPSLKDQVAEEVHVAMVRRRMNGSSLARKLGKDQTWVSRRLTGKTAFDLDDLQLIAAALDIKVEVLIGGTGPTRPSPPDDGLPHLDSNQKPFGFARRRQHAAMSSNPHCAEPVAA